MLPCMSVMLTCVLLNVARMFATPTLMFFEPLALTIFLPARSSPSNSAAVGALPATGPSAAGLASTGAAAGAASVAAVAAVFSFLGALGALAGFSAAASVFGLVSS